MRRKVLLSAFLSILIALVALFAPGRIYADTQASGETQAGWEFLDGKRVGMITGAPFEEAVREKCPSIEGVYYFTSTPDMIVALRAGKIDAMVNNTAVGTLASNRNDDLTLVPEPVNKSDMGLAFPKGSPHAAEFAEVTERMIEDGTADELWDKWTGSDEDAKTIPEQDWPGSKGTLTVAACGSLEPVSYLGENEKVLGYDIDTLLAAAKELDYHLNFIPMEFADTLAFIQSGKADIACGSILITEERLKAMDFATTHPNNLVLVGRKDVVGSAFGAGAPEPIYSSLDELNGKRIAYINGSVYPDAVEKKIEGTKTMFYESISDCAAAIESGKVDAAVQLSYGCQLVVNRSDGQLALMEEEVAPVEEGFFFPKGDPLQDKFNEVIEKFEQDGTIEKLSHKWVDADDTNKTLPEQDWDAPNGTLHFATSGVLEPFSYVGDGKKPMGYDVDLALNIAKELGYHLEISIIPMDSIFAAVDSGKADFGGTLTNTPERAAVCDFSRAVMPCTISVMVPAKGADSAGDEGFLAGLASSFEKTFVVEDRWKLVLSGLLITIQVSLCAAALGTALGFVTVLMRRRNNPVLSKIVDVFESLMGRLPLVVVLMVFYYVVFGALDIPGVIVAIVVFSLSFGAAAGRIMWNAVKAVDEGQSEASLALGFNDDETFFGVILPQAARRFLPLLSAQFVTLIKDTSIVGYIAVVDLTRASDLIRSRTMEAFFPLLSTAAVYFVVCSLLAAGMKVLSRRLDLDTRPREIKGVEL